MRRVMLSHPLPVFGLVSRYLTNNLIGHSPLPRQQAFDPEGPHRVLIQVSLGYPRPRGTWECITRPFAALLAPEGTFALDLHVLAMPPAFALSQDQTLQLNILHRPAAPLTAAERRRQSSSLPDTHRLRSLGAEGSSPVQFRRRRAAIPAGDLRTPLPHRRSAVIASLKSTIDGITRMSAGRSAVNPTARRLTGRRRVVIAPIDRAHPRGVPNCSLFKERSLQAK
jgi:hypothetical protein